MKKNTKSKKPSKSKKTSSWKHPLVKKIGDRWQPMSPSGAILCDAERNGDKSGYASKWGAENAARKMMKAKKRR